VAFGKSIFVRDNREPARQPEIDGIARTGQHGCRQNQQISDL
jgi:hypothetical protein